MIPAYTTNKSILRRNPYTGSRQWFMDVINKMKK
jgi:hypothetical protein